MADRYFVETPISSDQARLIGPEAHHLIHVMRAKPGDQVTVFDGTGDECWAEVRRVGRSDVEFTILERRAIDRESPVQLILGVGLPKGDRQKGLIEKAVEIGVFRLIPLRTARSVVQLGDDALGRLRRTAIEASKQCGRNRLMEIAPTQDWADFLAKYRTMSNRWVAHPETAAGVPAPVAQGSIVVAIGPEGGFEDAEVETARADGWTAVDLGPRLLRVETAVAVMAALALLR